jgi:arginine repressor
MNALVIVITSKGREIYQTIAEAGFKLTREQCEYFTERYGHETFSVWLRTFKGFATLDEPLFGVVKHERN